MLLVLDWVLLGLHLKASVEALHVREDALPVGFVLHANHVVDFQ